MSGYNSVSYLALVPLQLEKINQENIKKKLIHLKKLGLLLYVKLGPYCTDQSLFMNRKQYGITGS